MHSVNVFYCDRHGTYTPDIFINKLCEGLKGSAVTSLECAASPLLPRARFLV